MVDLYRVLGVSRDASSDDIKAAFRRLALKFHPDRHANASKSEQRNASDSFRQVKEAYEILGNDKKREVYNRSGPRYSTPGSNPSSTYSAAQAARSAYARTAQQHRDWRSEQRYTSYTDGSSSRSSDWSYRGNYAGSKRDYDYSVRWTFHHAPSEGPRMVLRATLFGMAVVTIMLADSMMSNAWRHNNTGKSYEEMVERLQQEKKAAKTRAAAADKDE
ncbi:chaperone protein dnaJ 72-like isoform X2 [Selaginella moellendorffii]|uniref:chaperone protein dnaJ 72-like isoform X2 n=1 Tax=Selaginella moellendorffii TaxID=88036 RepID=UPI000D1C6A79|nr:chaperone protein dnaJ 72-like isoform X2 [Selaginella moellendorffii]XP_024521049.1 chaperone protein dnaJ 72-like isoform X2 [Selaginella moellendorffii]XP_024535430.1 chaperone protein dnaJ 72-like isoform X2 [Selaginella moellendorffii]XP_024535431.1 chaperone protein dnaJ 72-like isoform X2 [Selaginella moellendorffii]|eukprot:XP_024521043.1 chaperone protein dnaJ 72-like isoform X2 [Selaginella moellendorffii]